MYNEFSKQGSLKSDSSIRSDFISSKKIGRKELYPIINTVLLKSKKEKTNFKNYYNNKVIPFTTPSRNQTNQNIYNIVFNNSNLNFQNQDKLNINNLIINSIPLIIQKVYDQDIKSNTRKDRQGVLIERYGKHSVTFMDRVNNKRLLDIVEIESFKAYNN